MQDEDYDIYFWSTESYTEDRLYRWSLRTDPYNDHLDHTWVEDSPSSSVRCLKD
ncbi:hypothetical protein [uncultured Fibrobacter sp.]|uniref:hypothetical protein n=1 Tax=uncultured Fibrobacter sp. TaxID=261512 RepID=UPI0025925520|nr:hypothetical protein [uncultured Fibrobacter sp.]